MDALCRTQPDKRLLNWRILAPGRVIFQEYFKSQMDVCQKFSEGKIRCVQSFPTLLTYLLTYVFENLCRSDMFFENLYNTYPGPSLA